MTIDEIIQLISGVGFPIATAAFCLFELNKTMQKMTDAFISLQNLIKTMTDKNGN